MIWPLTLVVALVDGLLVLAARAWIPNHLFRRIPRWIAVWAFLFYSALWSFVLAWAWEDFYNYVFPTWARWSGLGWGIAYGLAGLGMAWLSLRLPERPAVIYGLLGGLEGLLTHLWAIFGVGILQKPPMFRGVDPLTILAFAVFEKMFYWMVILFLAAASARIAGALRRSAQPV